jgi:hypothetical protein
VIEFLRQNAQYIAALVGVFAVGGAAGVVVLWVAVVSPLRARQDVLEERLDDLDPCTRRTWPSEGAEA